MQSGVGAEVTQGVSMGAFGGIVACEKSRGQLGELRAWLRALELSVVQDGQPGLPKVVTPGAADRFGACHVKDR